MANFASPSFSTLIGEGAAQWNKQNPKGDTMSLNNCSNFEIQTLTRDGWKDDNLWGRGLFKLVSNILAVGLDHTISITDKSVSKELPMQDVDDPDYRSTTYSLWSRVSDKWDW